MASTTQNAVHINTDSGIIHLKCKKTDTPLIELWEEQYSVIDEAVVLLSGGLDSQLTANLAKTFSKSVTAVIFDFVWNNNTINSYDVVTAVRFATQHGIPYEVKEVDLTDFFDNRLFSFAKKYKIISPQVAAQLYCIDHMTVSDNQTLMLGGDFPHIGVLHGNIICPLIKQPGIKSLPKQMVLMSTQLPFDTYSADTGIQIIKDPFYLTPEIVYQSFVQHAKLIESEKIIYDMTTTAVKSSPWKYKQAFYRQFEEYGFQFNYPLNKKTGFETLQVHLACITGRYNEFDLRYRQPLNSMSDQQNWLGPRQPKVVTDPDCLDVIAGIQDMYNTVQPTPCNIYTLDW